MKFNFVFMIIPFIFFKKNFCIDHFKYTQNANEYKPKCKNCTSNYGEFDFIIIGSGSTGSILASRLSEIPQWKILVLEAGDFGNKFADIPIHTFLLQFTNYNWGYFSTPQKHSCQGMKNHQCSYPRGRGIGGTSLINGMFYARPTWEDFQDWEDSGNPGWNYEEVLPYFRKSENLNTDRIFDSPIDKSVHGNQGPVTVEFHSPILPITKTFLQGNQELGVKMTDYNSGNGIGCSAMQSTTFNGSRMDTGKVYLRPYLNRSNLKVLRNSYVSKIRINSKDVARKVEFAFEGKYFVAKARKEIILSAGSINSPTILMNSGIGPKSHLEEFNIGVKKDLEVGSNLQDHPNFMGTNFIFDNSKTSLDFLDFLKEIRLYAENGTGIFASAGCDSSIVFLPSKERKTSDLELTSTVFFYAGALVPLFEKIFNFRLETLEDMFKDIGSKSVLNIFVTYSHAKSRGTVRLKSNDPFDYPLIDPNILSDPGDIEAIYESVLHLLKLSKTEAFKKAGVKLFVNPLKACEDHEYLSKSFWFCYIRQTTMHMFHPVGTCKMGPKSDPEAVVDHDCKVHGVKNLRVIDASVIPFNLAGHPNSVVIMMGEKMADVIKKQYGMKI